MRQKCLIYIYAGTYAKKNYEFKNKYIISGSFI